MSEDMRDGLARAMYDFDYADIGQAERDETWPNILCDETGTEWHHAADAAMAYLAAHDAEVTEALRAEVARLNHQADVDLMALNSGVEGMASADADRKAAEAKIAAVEAVMTKIGRWHNTEHDRVFTGRAGPELRDTLRQIYKDLRAALTDEPRP